MLNLVAGAAARARIARTGPSALVIRLRVVEVGLAGVAVAGREGAGAVADLDEMAEPVAGLVGVGLMVVVAAEGRHRVQAHGEPPAAGDGERPGAVAVRWGRLPRRACVVRRASLVRWAGVAARGERPRTGVVEPGGAGES